MALLVFSEVVTITKRQRMISSISRTQWTEKITEVRPICSTRTVKLQPVAHQGRLEEIAIDAFVAQADALSLDQIVITDDAAAPRKKSSTTPLTRSTKRGV